MNIEICNNCNSEIEISEFDTERNAQANVAGVIYVDSCRHCEQEK